MRGDELVEDFIARRSAGLAAAYEHYGIDLFTVARHVLGDGAAAEDCVHDALLRVWRAPGSFRPERGSLRSFLMACVRNEALSALRSAGRRSERERRAVRLDATLGAEVDSVDFVEAQRVRAALARLPQEQRQAIELAYFDNLTHAQVAERLGAPLGTIKSRISLGVRKLQTDLASLRT